MKNIYCDEYDDEIVQFNCVNYHLENECFLTYFGNHGVMLGEYIPDKKLEDFQECWKTKVKNKEI